MWPARNRFKSPHDTGPGPLTGLMAFPREGAAAAATVFKSQAGLPTVQSN